MPLASAAGLKMTLATFENELPQGIVTFLTLMRALDKPPLSVITFMIVSKILNSSCNYSVSYGLGRVLGWLDLLQVLKWICQWLRQWFGLSIYNLVCTNKQRVFIPLFTAAVLPFLPANITELSAATTTAIVLAYIEHEVRLSTNVI